MYQNQLPSKLLLITLLVTFNPVTQLAWGQNTDKQIQNNTHAAVDKKQNGNSDNLESKLQNIDKIISDINLLKVLLISSLILPVFSVILHIFLLSKLRSTNLSSQSQKNMNTSLEHSQPDHQFTSSVSPDNDNLDKVKIQSIQVNLSPTVEGILKELINTNISNTEVNRSLASVDLDEVLKNQQILLDQISQQISQIMKLLGKIIEEQQNQGEQLKILEKQLTADLLNEESALSSTSNLESSTVKTDLQTDLQMVLGSNQNCIPEPEDEHERNLIEGYNNNMMGNYQTNPASLSPKTTGEIRGGNEQQIELTKQKSNIFQIIDGKYLVPERNAVNSNNIGTVQQLFVCYGYNDDISEPKKFILRKPAEVTPLGEDRWKLKDQGFLDYRHNYI
jgi:hypothetical protein